MKSGPDHFSKAKHFWKIDIEKRARIKEIWVKAEHLQEEKSQILYEKIF